MDSILEQAMAAMSRERIERREAAEAAVPCLMRLIDAMANRSGQSFKIRSLLFSLWNGKPAKLSDVLCLDWPLRQDLCAVLLAFGYESKALSFFYQGLEDAISASGQWEWFREARRDQPE